MGKLLEKNPVRISSKFFLTALFVLFLVTSCNNMITPVDGSLVINLPSARSVSENVKEYKVDIVGLQGEKQSQTAKGGGSIVFNDVAPDTYTVTVEGLDENNKVILRGEGTTTVEPGKSASVTIELKVVGVLITFDDGTGSQYEKEVVYGEKLPANDFSKKEGKDFIHWTTEKDGSGTVYQNEAISDFTEPKTLYAQWGISHKVTFYANYDGAEPETKPQTVEDGVETTLTKNTFKREGYTFTGWDGNSDGNSGTRYNDEGKITTSTDLELYAQWTANTYRVVYNGNGGQSSTGASTVNGSKTFTYDEQGDLEANPFTREGYTFAGWTKDVAGTGGEVTKANNLTAVADETVTLYAQWTAHRYSVVYHANNGTEDKSGVHDFTYGVKQQLKANTFVKTDYTFVGWSKTSGETGTVDYGNEQEVENLTTKDGAVVNLYAQWSQSVFEITFNANYDGAEPETKTQSVGDGVETTLNATLFARTGYTITGWTTSDGTESYGANEEVTFDKNTTLNAQWTANTYTVKFNVNYEGENAPSDMTFTYDSPSTLPTITERTGYSFTGWSTVQSGGTSEQLHRTESKVYNFTSVAGETVTLYAQWEANTYRVVYNGNGGQTADGSETVEDSQTFTYDVQGTLTQNSFTREGYTFAGWTKDVADTGEEVTTANNLTAVAGGTVTLYAQWEANTYIVTFHANYGTSTETTTQEFTYGQSQALTANPLPRDGYTLTGWSTAKGITDVEYSVGQNITISEKLDLYAQWAVSSFEKLQSEIASGNTPILIGASFAVTERVAISNSVELRAVGQDVTLTASDNLGENAMFSVGTSDSSSQTSSSLTIGGGDYKLILDGNSQKVYGVLVESGRLVMKDNATITNAADSGVKINSGTFTMDGGEISNNTSSIGGGVYVFENATFNMNGGMITNNEFPESSTSGEGKGVYVSNNATFTMSGDAVVDSSNDVYLNGNATITVSGALANTTTPVATITLPTYTEGTEVLDGDTTLPSSEYTKFAMSNTDYTIGEDGLLKYIASVVNTPEELSVAIEKGGRVYVAKSMEIDYLGSISKNVTLVASAEGITLTYPTAPTEEEVDPESGAPTFRTTSNIITDGGSLTLDGSTYPLVLNINGWRDETIRVKSGGTFTMKGDVTIKNSRSSVVAVESGGSFVMDGGTITENSNYNDYGAVAVESGGSFIMNGGSITNNTGYQRSGFDTSGKNRGVYVASSGTFSMSGDAIVESNNDVYLAVDATITVAGDLTNATSPVATITPSSYSGKVLSNPTDGNYVSAAVNSGKFAVTPKENDDGSITSYTITSDGNLQEGQTQ